MFQVKKMAPSFKRSCICNSQPKASRDYHTMKRAGKFRPNSHRLLKREEEEGMNFTEQELIKGS